MLADDVRPFAACAYENTGGAEAASPTDLDVVELIVEYSCKGRCIVPASECSAVTSLISCRVIFSHLQLWMSGEVGSTSPHGSPTTMTNRSLAGPLENVPEVGKLGGLCNWKRKCKKLLARVYCGVVTARTRKFDRAICDAQDPRGKSWLFRQMKYQSSTLEVS